MYFARLADFFLQLTTKWDLVDDLIIDTMMEVWKTSASLAVNTSVAVGMMRLAYSFGKNRIVEAGQIRPDLRHEIPDADLEERALFHLVYALGHSRSDIAFIMNISCECVDLLLGDVRLRRRLVP